MKRPLVELENVRFVYPAGVEALRGLSLRLWPGELIALVGENGSGKTTLARLVSGLLHPTTGSITVDGVDASTASAAELARSVGLVFQNPDHQIFEKTVWDEVAFGLRNRGILWDEMETRVEGELRRHDLWSSRQRLPTSLSGGERKSVAFASTFVLDPKVLFLDEPTKGMDYGRKRRLAAMSQELSWAERCVVFITHDLDFAYDTTNRTIVLHRGRVLLDGDTKEVLANPAIEEAGLRLPPLVKMASQLEGLGLRLPIDGIEDLCLQLEGRL